MTVVVSDPHKVGEGMSSYMAYRVSTRYRAAFSGVGGVGGGRTCPATCSTARFSTCSTYCSTRKFFIFLFVKLKFHKFEHIRT